jgi:nitroreductase
MNAILEQISKHRSIRKFKANTPVKAVDLQKILEAATMASSSGNMQAYSIIISESEELKKNMMDAHFHQSMLMEAPLFLTFCADFHRMRLWLEDNQAPNNFDNFMSFMIAAIDAILASQNAALAAESLGYGICYMGTTLASTNELRKILECPSHVVPVVGFSLGVPDEMPDMRRRLPLQGLIHYEKYREYKREDIVNIYDNKNEIGMKRYINDVSFKVQLEEQKITNLAQVYTKLKYTEESHLKYSAALFKALAESGFLKDIPDLCGDNQF